MLKPILPFPIRMIPAFPTRIASIWTQTICMGGQYLNLCPLQQDEISTLKLQQLSDDAEDGYIFEVDLHYLTRLHDRHDDYPFAPESLMIARSIYSSTRRALFPESGSQRKLTPNLRDKVKYVVHYRNLTLYLQLGFVVTKVHRIFTFKQSPI